MTANTDLPVWTIRPNWQNGIVETLEWLSDVLRGSYGTEQVRALRLSPRRTFEMSFNPLEQERVFFELWLHRMSSDEFMLPLFHDHGLLTADIAGGATTIPFDTTYREFEVGGMALLLGPDAFTFDKVTIEAIAADSITVTAGGVTRAWAAGSSIHPLRRATLVDQSSLDAITDSFGEAALRFELNQENDIADEGAWSLMYGNYPVILDAPNRRENIKVTFDLSTVTIDNDVGLREMKDDAGRAFTLQNHLMMLVGRDEQWSFRQMLYRLRGQQGAVWLPTFNQDVVLSRDCAAADAVLDINQIGYGYTGGVVDGRAHLLINGEITRQITGVGTAPSATEEQLQLDSAVGSDLPVGTFASFMDTCRLGTDSIQITHITDTDGVAESALSFRSFRDERTTPDPIETPIPAATRTTGECGAPAVTTCVPALPTYAPGDPLASGGGGGGGGGTGSGYNYALIEIPLPEMTHPRAWFSAFVESPTDALAGVSSSAWLPIQGVAYDQAHTNEYDAAPVLAFPYYETAAFNAVSQDTKVFSLRVDMTSFAADAVIQIGLYGNVETYDIVGGDGTDGSYTGQVTGSQYYGYLGKTWDRSLPETPAKFATPTGNGQIWIPSGFASYGYDRLIKTFPELAGESFGGYGNGPGNDQSIGAGNNWDDINKVWTANSNESPSSDPNSFAASGPPAYAQTFTYWPGHDGVAGFEKTGTFYGVTVNYGNGGIAQTYVDTPPPPLPGGSMPSSVTVTLTDYKSYYVPTWNFANNRSAPINAVAVTGANPWTTKTEYDTSRPDYSFSWTGADGTRPAMAQIGTATIKCDPNHTGYDVPSDHFLHQRIGTVTIDRTTGAITFTPA